MCVEMLPPDSRPSARRSHQLPIEHRRNQVAAWSKSIAVINLVVAALTVLLWRGSLLVLALGAIILAELLILAVLYAVRRRGGR